MTDITQPPKMILRRQDTGGDVRKNGVVSASRKVGFKEVLEDEDDIGWHGGR